MDQLVDGWMDDGMGWDGLGGRAWHGMAESNGQSPRPKLQGSRHARNTDWKETQGPATFDGRLVAGQGDKGPPKWALSQSSQSMSGPKSTGHYMYQTAQLHNCLAACLLARSLRSIFAQPSAVCCLLRDTFPQVPMYLRYRPGTTVDSPSQLVPLTHTTQTG